MMENNNQTTEEQSPQGAFNVAVATLMRLDNILINIKDLILNPDLPKGYKQHKKYNLIRAYYVQSVALLKDDEDKKEIKDLISKLKPIRKERYAGGFLQNLPYYDDNFENSLDEALILIQEKLQKNGYFMPSKEDTGL